jgi:hypothetical protein
MATVLVLALGAGAVLVVVRWLGANQPTPVAAVCTSEVDGTDWALDPEQAQNAAVIAAIAVRRGLPAHAVTVALATALQESALRNLDYGDRDSLGLFQQRPSQGWGTEAEVTDPIYAAGIFYDRLVEVDGWETIAVTEAAQAVQRSAFPDAYAAHEGGARAFASALTGWSPTALTCTLTDAQVDAEPSTAALTDRLGRDLGLSAAPVAAGVVSVDATALGAGDQADRLGWAVGQWAVAVAAEVGVTQVQVGDKVWVRGQDGWAPAAAPIAAGAVQITTA